MERRYYRQISDVSTKNHFSQNYKKIIIKGNKGARVFHRAAEIGAGCEGGGSACRAPTCVRAVGGTEGFFPRRLPETALGERGGAAAGGAGRATT